MLLSSAVGDCPSFSAAAGAVTLTAGNCPAFFATAGEVSFTAGDCLSFLAAAGDCSISLQSISSSSLSLSLSLSCHCWTTLSAPIWVHLCNNLTQPFPSVENVLDAEASSFKLKSHLLASKRTQSSDKARRCIISFRSSSLLPDTIFFFSFIVRIGIPSPCILVGTEWSGVTGAGAAGDAAADDDAADDDKVETERRRGATGAAANDDELETFEETE